MSINDPRSSGELLDLLEDAYERLQSPEPDDNIGAELEELEAEYGERVRQDEAAQPYEDSDLHIDVLVFLS